MSEKWDSHKKYFAIIYSALIIIAIAVSTFIYSLLKTEPEDLVETSYVENVNGIDPSGGAFPNGPPNVAPPKAPPTY